MRIRGVLLVGLVLVSPTAGAAVTGCVVGTNGLPLGGATVSVYDLEAERVRAQRRMAGRPQTPLATVKTAADGSFILEPGRNFVWLQAEADGYAPVRQVLLDNMAPMVALRPAPLKRGVITAGGKPVAGAVVVWTSHDDAERISRTGPDGAYEAPDPRTAGGQLLVFHPDFAPLTAPDHQQRHASLFLDLNQQLDPGVIVAGTVVDHGSGRPVADAKVWIDGLGPLAATDAAGAFRTHAPRGWRIVIAQASGSIGTADRGAGPLVVRLEPERSVAGTIGDGVTGAPVAGATVVAWRDDGGPTGGTATDARGRYAIVGLAPGRYVLRVEHPGYTWVNTLGGSPEGIDLLSAVSARLDIWMKPLPRLRGQLEDEQGRPVQGAVVSYGVAGLGALYGRTAPFTGTGHPTPARTGADGSFTLTLSEHTGTFQSPRDPAPALVALHPGYAAGRFELPRRGVPEGPVLIKMSRGVELGGRVALPDGKPAAGVAVTLIETGLTSGEIATHAKLADLEDPGWATTDAAGRFSVRVHPIPHDLSFRKAGLAMKIVQGHQPGRQELMVRLENPVVIRGRVSRADGSGVPSVDVRVWQFPQFEQKQALTAADGTFEVRGLAPGRYNLTAEHAELGIREDRTVDAPANVAIVLEPRGTLRGRVVDGATGLPVLRFHMGLNPLPPTKPSGGRLSVDGEAGAFTMAEVPVGTFTAEVSAPGYLRERVENVRVSAGSATPVLEITLQAGALIRGRVTDADGQPAVKAAVRVTPSDGQRRVVQAGADGRFEARGLPPGEAVLQFEADGFLVETRTVDTRRAASVDVVLSRGLSLEGIVVRDGAGVRDATVSVLERRPDLSWPRASTDEHGRFRITGLKRGRYRVKAGDRDDSIVIEDVDVEHASPLRVVLGEVAALTVKVVGLPHDDGQEVKVFAAQPGGRSFSERLDDAQPVRFGRVPPGRLEVEARAETATGSRYSRKVELTLKPGEAAELTIEFPPGVTVSGRVVRDGQPVPGARVYFSGASGQGVGTTADARGIYEVAGLEPGPHTVRAGTDRGPNIPLEHMVTAGAQLDIDITTAGVSGRVVRAGTGAPALGARVSINRVGAATHDMALHRETLTDDHGSFSELELAPGRYRVTADQAQLVAEREVELLRGKKVEVVVELQASTDR